MSGGDLLCRIVCRSLDPYVDGELDAGHVVDVEAHLEQCSGCAAQAQSLKSTREAVRRAVASTPVPEGLRERLAARIVVEKRSRPPQLVGWRVAVGFAAAAGLALGYGIVRRQHGLSGAPDATPISQATSATAVGFDSLLDDLVALHARPLPPEATDPAELDRFDPLVGVPVRRPQFQPLGARFVGARVHALRDGRAALLQYTLSDNHRVTVYVFDPKAIPFRPTALHARLVRQRPVYFGNVRGYTVAAAETRGIGYAVASDLDDEKSAELVMAAAP